MREERKDAMETYDKAKAARVWQRVQGEAAKDPTQGLPGLIAEEWADAAIYLALSRRVQGNAGAVLRKIEAILHIFFCHCDHGQHADDHANNKQKA